MKMAKIINENDNQNNERNVSLASRQNKRRRVMAMAAES
jgi:hypothetical protein